MNRDNQCEYIKSHCFQCNSGGFIGYIEFFYCACEGWAIIKYIVLVVWLLALLSMFPYVVTSTGRKKKNLIFGTLERRKLQEFEGKGDLEGPNKIVGCRLSVNPKLEWG